MDSKSLHSFCRYIDIKRTLPFPVNEADNFFDTLYSQFEAADAERKAKYLNTMLNLRDLCPTLGEPQRQRIEAAFAMVCPC